MTLQEEKEDLLLPGSPQYQVKRNTRLQPVLLIISVVLNILLGILLLNNKVAPNTIHEASYELGFSSDLVPVRSQIEIIVQKFSGGVELDIEGNFFSDPGGRDYVGSPTPAVDESWETLLGGLNLDLDVNEIDLADSFRWPESGMYFTGLDVYHSLHCLNRLRQAIYPDYYRHVFDKLSSPSRSEHIDHCIDHIRQSLQCHADLTPMEWNLVGNKVILKTDTDHSCRNFAKIHTWALSHRTRFEDIHSFLNGSLQIVD